MKKSLSLLAIVCLVLSMGLVSQVLANAPVYPEVPSVKLYTNSVGLTPAFDLAWFNTAPDGFNGDKATSYSITANFLNNASLGASSFSGLNSNVNAGGFSSATDGSNSFSISNAGGTATPTNKTKFSTYIQNELPVVGLYVGSSYTQTLSSFTAGGAANAPSFGNPNALIVSDTTKVSAVWANGSTAVTVTLLAATTSPVFVDVIASPVASGAIGVDQDKERIAVYSNLLLNGQFSAGADTAAWGLQAAPGKTTLAGQNLLAADSDSANTAASGVWQFTFADANGGVKATPFGNYIPMSAGKWYISRMRIADKTAGNSDQALLFSFSTAAGAGFTSDIAADVFPAGVPTTWTWMEAPFFVHASQTGFPQFQLKAGGAGSVDIDEIQVIQATPKILDGKRGNIRSFYSGGLFTAGASTTNWGTQGYFNAAAVGSVTPQPPFTLTSDTAIGSALSANFAGAASGAGQIGFKWTAATSGTIYTPAVVAGREFGATMQIDVASGLTGGSELSQALIAAYSVPSNGAATPLDKIDAAAEVGVVLSGTIASAGVAKDGFAQLQFGFRADATGVVNFANVDVISDNNDRNFGDVALFP